MAFGKHISGDQDVNLAFRSRPFRLSVGFRGEGLHNLQAFIRMATAIHPADSNPASLFTKLLGISAIRIAQLAIEISGGILVVGENQDFLALKVARKKGLQTCEFRIVSGIDTLNFRPHFCEHIHVVLNCFVQATQII